ncbi:hypothetical protein DPMN_074541 [Dreissena polymorpha]|uniref:Uncharacterized protein n=1 Tax=Dreissena polymorpha TaxID=45954 RepID=A0A9D3YK18_DREPO|nr:hypothetical protein DPMN_074541 [Dreissena polymorpha]
MIARTSGHFVASGGVGINFTRHRAREGIELRSKKDRTINERLSPGVRPTSDSLYVYPNERRPASVGHRAEALRQSDGRRPMYMPLGSTFTFFRYTLNESDVGRSPGDTRALIVRSCFDLNSIPSRARRRVNFLVRLKINPDAARCYKLTRFPCDHRPIASPMSGKMRRPLIGG